MDNIFQDLGPPNANLPNAQGNELDQVYSNIQVSASSKFGIYVHLFCV